MKFIIFPAIVGSAVFLAGCGKTAPPPPPPPAHVPPSHAQSKLPTLKIFLGAEILDAELALTQMQMETGMMFRTNIQDADAMLFDLRLPQRANFWMMNCPESISAAYIDSDGVIREIHHLEKNDTNGVESATGDIRFVLETSDGWFTRHHLETGTVIRTERGSLRETFSR
jgi:uncharacterized membrane protein (UPF0127 family)